MPLRVSMPHRSSITPPGLDRGPSAVATRLLQTSLRCRQTTPDAFQRLPAWLKQWWWILMQNQYEIFILSISVQHGGSCLLANKWVHQFLNKQIWYWTCSTIKYRSWTWYFFRKLWRLKAPCTTELRSAAILDPPCLGTCLTGLRSDP